MRRCNPLACLCAECAARRTLRDVAREAPIAGPFRAMPGDVAMHPSLDELHRVHLKRTADLFGDAAQRPEPDEARRVVSS